MSSLFDLWPFNVASGPAFLLLYALFGAVAIVGGHVLARLIVARFDRSDVGKPSIRPATYRASATPPALAIGVVPQREHVWTVAYLRDGASGVREGLIAAA